MAEDTTRETFVMKYMEGRADELRALDKETRTKRPKLAQQRLPRHMRRRAASHNPKRIPASIRLAIDRSSAANSPSGDDSGTGSKAKNKLADSKEIKKTGKKRHRNEHAVKRSLKTRMNRPDKFPLHLWFAKRFKMQDEWGRKFPWANAQKNERVLYRHSRKGSIFMYPSQWSCLQISCNLADKEKLLDGLSSFSVEAIKSDDLEHTTILHEKGEHPRRLIGPCIYSSWSNESRFCMNVWIHISLQDILIGLIRSVDSAFAVSETALQRLRIIGPKANETCSKFCASFMGLRGNLTLKQFLSTTPSSSRLIQRASVNISEMESHELTFVKFAAKCFLMESAKSTEAVYCKRHIVDMICDSSVKGLIPRLWTELTRNKSHLVGGLRDEASLFFNASFLHFPFFGFPDSHLSSSSAAKFRSTDSEFSHWGYADNRFVVRDANVLKSIALEIEKIATDSAYAPAKETTDKWNNAFVMLDLRIVGKGTPEDGDWICAPVDGDLDEKYAANMEPVQLSTKLARQVIGFVERGSRHCWSTASGKAIGTVHVSSLLLAAKAAGHKLSLLIKSPSCSVYRLARCLVIDSSINPVC